MCEGTSLANRYPGSECDDLANRIARMHGVAPEQVVLGCGSSEILRVTAVTFLGPGKKLVMASPSWNLIADFARSTGAEIVTVPLNKEYAHDLSAMLARIDRSTGLVYICNPNDPTGSLTPQEQLVAFIRRLPSTTYIVIDQAYHHYAVGCPRDASVIEYPVDDSRLIVTRTFSGDLRARGITRRIWDCRSAHGAPAGCWATALLRQRCRGKGCRSRTQRCRACQDLCAAKCE